MPGGMHKTDGHFMVLWGGKKTAKKTTHAKGQRQLNLLRALEHNPNWRPTKNRQKRV